MPSITQGKTNWKFLLIVVILAAVAGGGTLWCVTKQEIPTPEFLKAKKTEESVAAKEIILADEEIVEILKEFAAKITARFRDAEVDKILLDALEFRNTDTRDRLHNLIGKFEDLSETIEDAPDLRSWKIQRTKLCLAESIISDDLENTTQRCGYEAESSFTGADDLLADTQIISFFINGFAHYYKEDYPKADYYFDQIKLHYSFLESFEVDFNAKHLELYNKIYNKVSKIFSEIVKDETADWQTYRNDAYGFEIRHLENWYVNKWCVSDVKCHIAFQSFHQKIIYLPELIKIKGSVIAINVEKGYSSIANWLDEAVNKGLIVSEGEKIIIGGEEAHQVVVNLTEESKIAFILLYREENLYIFGQYTPPDCSLGKCKIFNQMLSTFRFIEV